MQFYSFLLHRKTGLELHEISIMYNYDNTLKLLKVLIFMSTIIDDQFEIIKELGEGGQGKVFLVKNIIEGKQYALNKLEKNSSDAIKRIKKENKH